MDFLSLFLPHVKASLSEGMASGREGGVGEFCLREKLYAF